MGFDPTRGDLLGQPPRHGLRLDVQPVTKIGQGHRDQWLAVLAQSGLDADAELQVGDQSFSMRDWVNQVQYDVPLNLEKEYSWTLIALTAFDDTDHAWTTRDGETLSTESLLKSELAQDLQDSACGGTHRLIGIAMALQKRKDEGAPITGVWLEAQQVVDDNDRLGKAKPESGWFLFGCLSPSPRLGARLGRGVGNDRPRAGVPRVRGFRRNAPHALGGADGAAGLSDPRSMPRNRSGMRSPLPRPPRLGRVPGPHHAVAIAARV